MEVREVFFTSENDPLLARIVGLFSTEWSGFEAASLYRKYADNPAAKADTPHFLCVFDGEDLVAANGYIPALYTGPEGSLACVQDCDSFVAKAYRKQGLFSAVIERAEKIFTERGYDVLYGFPNSRSFKAYSNAGWTHNRDIVYTMRLLDPRSGFSRRTKARASALLKPLASLLYACFQRSARSGAAKWRARGYTEEALEGGSYRDDPASRDGIFALELYPSYVAWRFPRERGRYTTIRASGGAGRGGEVLLKSEEGKSTVRLLALSGESAESRRAALAFACDRFSRSATKILACAPIDEGELREFRTAGFLSPRLTSRLWGMRTPFVYKCLRPGLDLGRAAWRVQFSDYDTV